MSAIKEFFENIIDHLQEKKYEMKEQRFIKKVNRWIEKEDIKKLEDILPETGSTGELKIKVVEKLGAIGAPTSFAIIKKDFKTIRKFKTYHEEIATEIKVMGALDRNETISFLNKYITKDRFSITEDIIFLNMIKYQLLPNLNEKLKSIVINYLLNIENSNLKNYDIEIKNLIISEMNEFREIIIDFLQKPISFEKSKPLIGFLFEQQFEGLESFLENRLLGPAEQRLFIVSNLQKLGNHKYDQVILGDEKDYYRLYDLIGPFSETMIKAIPRSVFNHMHDEDEICIPLGYEKEKISTALINEYAGKDSLAMVFAEVLFEFGDEIWIEIFGGKENERDLSKLLTYEEQIGIDKIISIFNICNDKDKEHIATTFLKSGSMLRNLEKVSKTSTHKDSHSDSVEKDRYGSHEDWWDTTYRRPLHIDEIVYNHEHKDSHSDYISVHFKDVKKAELDF